MSSHLSLTQTEISIRLADSSDTELLVKMNMSAST